MSYNPCEEIIEKVTRVVVVNHSNERSAREARGRIFEKWGIKVCLSLQDGGQTLKIFVDDPN